MNGIIDLQGLVKTFPGGIKAVDDISLSVREGEFVTLLGPSGCGKTTTLRMIAGFESPDSGRIYLNGTDVTDLPPYHRQVNTVFQDYALFPHMTIAENVGYGLRVAGVPKADIAGRVRESMQTVDLLDKAGDRPAQLSGGQKQRVALARALVRKPKVLLLDEPLSALDARLRETMRVELRHLHDKLGLTFIFVTHDQTEALVMSDRVVVMKDGRIVQEGAPTELYEQPVSPYVANFLGSSNLIPGKAASAGADGVTIELQATALHGHGAGISAGDAVIACVRPEKAVLVADGDGAPDGHSLLSGVVREHFFHGSVVRLEIDIGEAALFMVDIQLQAAAGRAAVPQPGARVNLAVDPANISVFAGDGET